MYLEYGRGEKTRIWFRVAVATPIQLNKTLKSQWESSNRPFGENVLNTNNNREEKGSEECHEHLHSIRRNRARPSLDLNTKSRRHVWDHGTVKRILLASPGELVRTSL